MAGLHGAKKKDEILKFLLTEPNGMNNMTIARKLFQNKTGPREVELLLREMVSEVPSIVDLDERKDSVIAIPNDLTKKYAAENGYFTQCFMESSFKKIDENKKNEEAEKLEREFRELQSENLKLSTKLSRQKLKTHWIPIAISIIGVLVAIALRFIPTDNSLKEKVYEKLEQQENELELLKTEFKRENDVLKDELSKVQTLFKAQISDSISN